jgi:hypothetical protein
VSLESRERVERREEVKKGETTTTLPKNEEDCPTSF